MTLQDFESFLNNAGNAYEIDRSDSSDIQIWFHDRGWPICGHVDAEDPTLLHLSMDLPLTKPTIKPEIVRLKLLAIEQRYKAVKLYGHVAGSKADSGFIRLSTEQFEQPGIVAADIFWHTVDVMREAAIACNELLELSAEDNRPNNIRKKDILELEAALRAGCHDTASDGSVVDDFLPTIALIEDGASNSGTGFCVASNGRKSFYVTNAHVVGRQRIVTLYRQYPKYQKLRGTVTICGDSTIIDLALIEVRIGMLPCVSFSSRLPRRNEKVALPGYPRVQMWASKLSGEICAAIHQGTITSTSQDGSDIFHDVLSRPGNSGSPLVDLATGRVFGVQSGGWETEEEGRAIGNTAVLAFLEANGFALPVP